MSGDCLKFLLVDVDEENHRVLRPLCCKIARGRYELAQVPSVEQARQALETGAYDVCLLDHRLAMGAEFERLRDLIASGCRTPILLLNGLGDRSVETEIGVEAVPTGAVDNLVSGPFGGPHLDRAIRQAISLSLERQDALEALRRSEERYALAVRGANDGLWDWDLIAGRVYFAPRWKAMLGYDDTEIGDSPEEWLGRIHPLDREQVREEIASHCEGLTAQLQSEHRMLHHDGSYRWVLSRGLVVRDAEGRSVRMAGSQTDINDRKEAEDRLYHDAFHDTLTGLANRALLSERLGRAILRTKRHSEYRFAVLFLDLDGFKVINDRLGHQTGDQLLMAISQRLEACVRGGDTVGRLGGDEFIILLDDLEDSLDVIDLADRILKELQRPFVLNGHELTTSASIGIALSTLGYDRADELLRDADIAMYRAKSQGKSSHVLFDKGMHNLSVTRLKLEADLQDAALRQEFRLHYQPVVSLYSGQITGFEALLRWNHPERGLVAPDEFIPVAEETKMILAIGLWVLREATRQRRKWERIQPGAVPLTISVNLSRRQFLQPELAAQIEAVLDETHLDPRCLKLEISESVIREQWERAPGALARLKDLGVRLAIDNFGQSGSSVNWLQQLTFDALKIDRSLVARLGSRDDSTETVRTIVTLASSLELDVIAQGVETEAQAILLRELGCQHGQGYLFSRPLAGNAAAYLVSRPTRWFDFQSQGPRSFVFQPELPASSSP